MITYDDNHKYTVDGVRMPSVTEICSILAPRFHCDPWYLERGRIGHLITEYYDQKYLDENTVDDNLRGYFIAYKRFISEVNPKIELIEKPLCHSKYKYCGKPDRYGMIGHYKSVWDLKFGQPTQADVYQAPPYLFLLRANGFKAEKCWDVYLSKNGKYKIVEVRDVTDKFLIFLSALNKWKEENNGDDRG